MKLTTKNIIKILPFTENFKLELLEQFDTLEKDVKFPVEQAVWDLYATLYEIKLEENTDLALARAAEDKETLDRNFYKRMRQQTDKQMREEYIHKGETVDLTSARKAMEQIVKEIQAAKKSQYK